ncbi:MAG: transketolase [Alphaproteobacteria bacterium]|nr:transketolase [Alphaproteobacteria bacterium]
MKSTNLLTKSHRNPEIASRDLSNCLRFLAIDAVQKANSGHPGLPMGMADVIQVLFSHFMKFDASHPEWPDRDRFVLSAGHGSMLLYGLNYCLGYKGMTLDQLKNFRQLHSHTAGHPEVDLSLGIETTTGPLGQGLATAIGMAIAETNLRARFGEELVNHRTFVLASDGDLMEGISHEAASLAGHLKLSKLTVLYDDNSITIDGPMNLSCSDDALQRFMSYGWHVQSIDGHDEKQIFNAIESALADERPSLIACKTTIGYGAPNKQGSESTHGSPLGTDEVAATRKNLNWNYEAFEIPEHLLDEWRQIGNRNNHLVKGWESILSAHPQSIEFKAALKGDVSQNVLDILKTLKQSALEKKPALATRQASGEVLQAIFDTCPMLIGGSADLSPSNNTMSKGSTTYNPQNQAGRYIHYGIREHAMAAIMNGLALHKGLIPYGGTFLTFTDYCRPAIRLAALMKQRVIYVMTHDSIGLGEDGPTHQPIEHLAALRAIPNLTVFRPADLIETIEAWEFALQHQEGPTLIALSRQSLPAVRTESSKENLSLKGAYLLKEFAPEGQDPATIFATGSEVHLALEAHEKLKQEGLASRVISVPSTTLFEAQEDSYQESILCYKGRKIAIEAGIRQGWDRYIGPHGYFIGMHGFGLSAPAKDLYSFFGITSDAICDIINKNMKK